MEEIVLSHSNSHLAHNKAVAWRSSVRIEAAVELRDRGVKAITGACGFMAFFQEDVEAAVEIPVFLSSLMQIPFIHALCGGSVGLITANASRLTPRHFEACKVPSTVPLAIAGMEDRTEFREAILEERGTLDSAAIEREVTEVARALVEQNADVRSILLECSDLPPYAHAIQAATGRPVFDFITMIDYVQQSTARKPYFGGM
ncbi:aspartate/glutamate racemase family protein [Mesorhizobium sp. ORM8.1]